MSLSEQRQVADTPTILPNQCRKEIPSSGPEPRLATATLPNCVGRTRMSLDPQSDAIDDGQLVYALSNATEAWESASDELLLQHVAEGDKAAMHIMVARHRARVFHFIRRMVRNSAIADDLVSQVFLDVWRTANKFEHRARVSTWLLSITRLKALSSLRKQAYESIDPDDDVAEIVDSADTPDVAFDRKTTNAILRACINRLSPAQRELIDLFYYRDKSAAEASEIIGVRYATAKSRLFYARKQLARMLVNAGFTLASN